MKRLFIFCSLFLAFFTLWAQAPGGPIHRCFADEIWSEMVHRDSSLLERRHTADMAISQMSNDPAYNDGSSRSGKKSLSAGQTKVIPTVIYVVYDSTTVNISMTQIQSQMDQLNLDFAPYGYGFCYAKRNAVDTSWFVPRAGDSAGVFRISNNSLSNVDAYSTDAQLKALSALPAASYMRIFIVHTITPAGILGYAHFPGSSAAQDGIVVRSDVFGSHHQCPSCTLYPTYDLGATLTHEVGHYLNLYHTFQGGCDTGTTFQACQSHGDWVCDTPPTDGSFGCPNPAPLSCNGGDSELINNYMDYTDDPCKNAFTNGQKNRMDFSVLAYRQVLVSTGNLIKTGVTCVQIGNQYANFYCANFNGCKARPMTFASLGAPGFTYTWTFGDGTTLTGDTVQHTYAASGEYYVQLHAVSTSPSVDVSTTMPVFITPCQSITCSTNKWDDEYGYMDFSTGTPIAINHPTEYSNPTFADVYMCFYRADSLGHPLFHISPRASGQRSNPLNGLLDSSFTIVDSLGLGQINCMTPVPGHSDQYCFMGHTYRDLISYTNNIDSMDYSIIQTRNGVTSVRPGKRMVSFPFPPGPPHRNYFQSAAIPSCDGSKFWVIVNCLDSNLYVFQLDSSATVTYHSMYHLPTYISNPNGLVPSHDGKKMAFQASIGTKTGMVVLNFDKSTGNFTAYDTLYSRVSPSNYYGMGTINFSANSRFIYQAEQCCYPQASGIEDLYQYDLYNPHPYATRRHIAQYTIQGPWHPGSCYLGPDQKMYVGIQTNPGNGPDAYRIGVINYPDRLENGLNSVGFNRNGPDIRPVNSPYAIGMSFLGFYDFFDHTDAYGCGWKPNVPTGFSYNSTGCLSYQLRGDDCFSAQWNFGDPSSGAANTSTLSSPTHIFSGPGRYPIRLVASGYTFHDTIIISAPSAQIAGTSINPCPVPHADYSIATIQPWVNYTWTVTHGLPASVSGQSDINVQWNAADTNGIIMVIAIDTVMGCRDTSITHLSYHVSGSTSVTNTSAHICTGTSYPFHGRNLTATGIYSDTATLPSGCKSVTRLHLLVTSPPAVTWAGGIDTVSVHTGGITLGAATPAGGVYSGRGVHGITFYPDSVAGGADTITYTYTDTMGCSGTARHIYHITTGIGDLSLESLIRIYPNPANKLLMVESDLLALSDVQISLYDMTGRGISVVIDKGTSRASLNISGLADGMYCIKFTVDGRELSRRFVKMELN